jgi:predicted metal-dependent phosphoesterase TrpH
MLFDLHIHSKYSVHDCLEEISDIIETAKKAGLSGIAICDHNSIEGSREALSIAPKGLLIIPGVEVSSADGHIICLGVEENIKRDQSAEKTIKRVHELGGIAIAAHPYDAFRRGVGDLSYKLDFDAIEVNGHCLWGNAKAAKAAIEHGKPLVAGSDAHALNGIGAIATETEAKTVAELINNIKTGNCEPRLRKNKASLKISILADKICRKYNLARKL